MYIVAAINSAAGSFILIIHWWMKAAERQIQINYQEFVCFVWVRSENM